MKKSIKLIIFIFIFAAGYLLGINSNKTVNADDNTLKYQAHINAEKYAVSKKMIYVASKELKMPKDEVENILWRCAALECDPGFGFQMLDPSLSDKDIEKLVSILDNEN